MKMRWSLVLISVAIVGLMLQAGSGAADDPKPKKKQPAGQSLTVNGELNDQDVKDKVRTNSYCKTFGFKMEKGKTYQIDMKSKDLDSYLRLEDPSGKEVASDDDGGGFPDARIVYKADESGDFKVVATTFKGGATGKFTLTAAEKGAAIELKNDKGQAKHTGKLDKDDPLYKGRKHKLCTFDMEEGKTYQIDMVSGNFDSYLYLESPDGKLLDEDDDGGGFPNARITYKAAKAGKHRIICTHFGGGGGLGEFTLTVQEK